MKVKNWSALELIVTLLFLSLTVTSILLPEKTFISEDAFRSLYLTGIINAVLILIYLILRLICRFVRRNIELQAGMLLFILYNTIPVLFLIRTMFTTGASIICIAVVSVLLVKFDNTAIPAVCRIKPFSWNKFKMVFSAMVLIVFSFIFIGRGVVIIAAWASGGELLSETAVSIADVVISLIWLAAGTVCFRNRQSSNKMLLPVFIQAVLLFVTLIIFMVFNPLVSCGPADISGIIVVTVMAAFFIIPAVWLVQAGREKDPPSAD